jgi:energy-coupling factor transport system substrate-specific component
MMNMKSELPRTRKITYTAILIALAISLRLIKYALFGPMQFVNFPGIFTLISGVMFGPITGVTVGFASYLFSDILLGAGPWTAVNAFFMAIIGLVSGLIWSRKDKTKISKAGLGIGAYVLMFAFDVTTSWLLLITIGVEWFTALVIGLLGLFMPASGGFLIGVGPITEATTAVLTVMLVFALNRGIKKVYLG